MQLGAPIVGPKVPGPHREQRAAPASENLPTPHAVQLAEETLPWAAEKRPAAHLVQLAAPSCASKVPGGQIRQ